MTRRKEEEQKNQKDEVLYGSELIEEGFDQETIKNITHAGDVNIQSQEEQIFAKALMVLNRSGVPYAVGAAFARHVYTGIWRMTKDLDVFIKAEDLNRALVALQEAGFKTEIEFDHWLAKAQKNDQFIDLLFGTGHGQLTIDDRWIERSQPGEILGVETRLVPLEEMIALGCFVAERGRFDASEVVHLIHSAEGKIDWTRVLELLGNNWELLLWQLIFFDYVYPSHPDYLPQALMIELFNRVKERWTQPTSDEKAFRGTVLDPFSFTVDVEDWGYEDRRSLEPRVDSEGKPL